MSKPKSNPNRDDCRVGKGRPPEWARWKSGQSGNPKGRPKGSKSMMTILNDALNQTLEINDKGRVRKISAREGIVRRLVNEALRGNLKATAVVFAKEPEIVRSLRPKPKITPGMSAQEASAAWQEILESMKKDRKA
jgi:Family of unknown function (DUF5681)